MMMRNEDDIVGVGNKYQARNSVEASVAQTSVQVLSF